jgi:phosphopantetheinyl transferase
LALYALTKSCPLGIDLERIRPDVAVAEIADRFFPPDEAVKARGEGLSLPLKQAEAARWTIEELVPAPDYVAAVAAEGDGWRLRYWQWPQESQPPA